MIQAVLFHLVLSFTCLVLNWTNLEKNILDKSTKLSNICFSVEYFIADFIADAICSATVKYFYLDG